MGQTYESTIPDQDDDDDVIETPIETYLQDSSNPDSQPDFKPYTKPDLESTNDTIDHSTSSLVTMLSSLNLQPSPKIKVEDESHIFYSPRPITRPLNSAKPVGVRVGIDGSNVTVLTPIKASRKLQNGKRSDLMKNLESIP
jgi:hypothetical protein